MENYQYMDNDVLEYESQLCLSFSKIVMCMKCGYLLLGEKTSEFSSQSYLAGVIHSSAVGPCVEGAISADVDGISSYGHGVTSFEGVLMDWDGDVNWDAGALDDIWDIGVDGLEQVFFSGI